MITCKLIGGLGNQLFISATCIATALRFNQDYCLPRKVHHPHYPANKDHSYDFPNIKYCDQEPSLPVYQEPHFHYAEIPYMPDICLNGYFQSYKYFDEYREKIIKTFDFPYKIEQGWVSLHVRRGDYLDYPNHHPTVTIEYIFEAIEHFKSLGYFKFFICSDGIDWCYDNIKPSSDCEFMFSEGRTEVEDMAIASLCEHNIGSNSSFSWWIYYLNQNPNKIGIFPKKWFGAELPNDSKDLLPPECIVL